MIALKCQYLFLQGEWEAAIALFTEAIKLNPNSAAMFAKRGWVSIVNSFIVASLTRLYFMFGVL